MIDSELDLLPIRPASLRLGTVADFNIYIRTSRGDRPVLYAQRGVEFTVESRRRLAEQEGALLYIQREDAPAYRQYLEITLQDTLDDPEVPIQEKREILYLSAQSVLKDVFENPETPGMGERTHDLVEGTIGFLFSDQSALRHLITSAARDYHSYTHSINVSILGLALARKLGYHDAETLCDFGQGALLRDIGMVQIDPGIPNKKGKLTPQEFAEIKKHPVIAHRILRKAGGVNEMVLDIVRHHHEKLDGSGYPDRLRDKQIAPLVRICTIVDVFDALTTNRPYKAALDTYEALQCMTREMRNQLDMDMLSAFIGIMGDPDHLE